MMFLKKETTIPVPEVIEFFADFDIVLGVPYVLMSYIFEVPLEQV